jgi:hypothetical protein
MAKTKYGHLVKSLSFRDDGQGSYRQCTRMTGEFLNLNCHIEYGTYWTGGRTGGEPDASEVHDFNQAMIWMGADTSDLSELGAEVELSLGKERERHVITQSTAAFIPKGLPHLPATITRMDKRFIFMMVSCASELKARSGPPAEGPSEYAGWKSKYGDYLLKLTYKRKGAWLYGPLNQDDSGGSVTDIIGQGFDFLMIYESIKKAPYRFGPMPERPHAHPYDEILIFMGADCNDLSELGAEAELCLGKEKEVHVINKPTVVVVPKIVPHCPLQITKLYKPFIYTIVRPFVTAEKITRRI